MITAVEPRLNKDGRYSSAEASRLLGIHRNTLIAYTRQGLIKCGYRRENARKFFTGAEILRFWKAQL